MREIIYFSTTAKTSGNFDSRDLMKAGRWDIVIHSLINSLFISNSIRTDVKFHIVSYGTPNPPRHLEFTYHKDIPISKKDVAGLIKRMLYKCNEKKKIEVFPGCSIEKKNLFQLLEEKVREGKDVYVMDKKGGSLRDVKFDPKKDPVFLIGDHEGLPKKELKKLKKEYESISVGNRIYLASQIVTILNYELDCRGF